MSTQYIAATAVFVLVEYYICDVGEPQLHIFIFFLSSTYFGVLGVV